jgi:hypothetical protein
LSFTDIYERISIPFIELLFDARIKLLEERNKRQEEALKREQMNNDRDRSAAASILPPNMR